MRDDSTPSVSRPLCACGCGLPAPGVRRQTNTKRGHVKGEPALYRNGHHHRRYRHGEKRPWPNRAEYYQEWARQRRLKEGKPEPKTRSEAVRGESPAERKAWIVGIKLSTPCKRCGIIHEDPKKIHFHHRDPATKLFSVGATRTRSRVSIEAEMAKCDILCAPCHSAVHREMGTTRGLQRRRRANGQSM